ncbi:uncharacterized protein MONBRDRAFT_11915 [Monosiga brevicollis MX1]|uniref:Thioredoxin domain-containing protein n=1 Tax=Monosiga brevicollis TaxID=81824 RepID=A9VAN5_MONBE|nr:uncharacterized protein MONBRDRAFT_11915 [Monosiga brevicollis MX1]EDQ85404.1 predicted protein [Monosiga brevicollis MX1]|eukprot:XP_001749815.1 hypothetical protein [Monosiga brevicollis MX1]
MDDTRDHYDSSASHEDDVLNNSDGDEEWEDVEADNVLVNLNIAPSVGDKAVAPYGKHLISNRQLDVADIIANHQVVVLEYWAAFAPPSLQMVQQDAAAVQHRQAEWGDRVTVLACNLDDDFASAQSAFLQLQVSSEVIMPLHVNAEENARTYMIDCEYACPFSCASPAPSLLRLTLRRNRTAVPMAVVIHNGTIKWRGHRDDINLITSINNLLDGGAIQLETRTPHTIGPKPGVPDLASLDEDAIMELCDSIAVRNNTSTRAVIDSTISATPRQCSRP